MTVDEIARVAVDAGLFVHRELGPGMLESAYETVLAHVLRQRGLDVACQQIIPIAFGDLIVAEGFRADMIVEGKLLIELKSVERLLPVHSKQVFTYLRFLNMPVGLLMNFGAPTFREGLKRIANRHDDSPFLGELGVLGVRPTSCTDGAPTPTSAL